MKYSQFIIASVVATAALTHGSRAAAPVQTFTSFSQWQSAVGPFTTIDFAGFRHHTVISTQYESQGVVFSDDNDQIALGLDLFPLDGFGLYGWADGHITLSFASPQNWIGAYHPGDLGVHLYSQGELVFSGSDLIGGGVGFFHGWVSTQPFDSAVLFDPLNNVVLVDDIYFGAVPAPGALGLLGVASLCGNRRRRYGPTRAM